MEFLERFFGIGNEITFADIENRRLGDDQLAYLDLWLPALQGPSPGPVILPRRADGTTTYYAIALSDQQGRLLREDLLAFIGITYTDFTGVDLPLDSGDPVEAAIADLIEPLEGRAYRFRVTAPEDEDQRRRARERVRSALTRLRSLWETRPDRTRPVPKPTGRLLRDYYQALNAADDNAAQVAIRELRSSGRLSAINFVYLEVQRLAVTRQWSALLGLEVLPTLLQVGRPPRVTDAIAQAVVRSHTPNAADDLDAAVATFEREVLPTYGVLFGAARELRSVDGARYALLASVAAGGPPAVDPREVATGEFGDDPLVEELVARLLARQPTATPVTDLTATLDDIALELEHRRPERALALVLEQIPNVRAAELALRSAAKLQALEAAISALEYVEMLSKGDRAELLADRLAALLYDELYETLGGDTDEPIDIAAVPVDWVGWLRQLDDRGARAVSVALAREGAEQWAADPQFTEPVHINELIGLLQVERTGEAAEVFWNALPHLLTALDRADSPAPALGGVYSTLYSTMALRIVDERTSADLLMLQQLLDWQLQIGLDPGAYAACLDDLHECWEAIRSAKTVTWGIDTLELLLDYPVAEPGSLDRLADAVFDQARDSAGRLDEITKGSVLIVADAFSRADQFTALLAGTRTEELSAAAGNPTLPAGSVIALYSLTESALVRASQALTRLYPGVHVETASDHVCSDRLRSLSRSALIFVLATKSAKHAATECVEAHRPAGREVTYAVGKGTSSLLAAVERATSEFASRG